MIRLAVRVARADAELALAELLALAPAGVEEVEVDERTIEYAVYGASGELPALPDVRAVLGSTLVEVETTEVADDWPERWREFHQPVCIGERLWVRPPWTPPARDGLIDIAIEPGQAFGTGAHPTTRSCLELLLGLSPAPPRALLDIGCGSGVLAIAAAKLGWEGVIAVDHDRESVTATADNAAANGVHLDVRRLDLRRDELPRAATIVANLLAPLLLELAHRLPAAPRELIAGGLLAGQEEDVAAALRDSHGLHEKERRTEGEWVALLLTRN